MERLLDKIFLELDIKKLDAKKGREYLLYLNEILGQIKSETEFQKILAIRDRLIAKTDRIDSRENKATGF